MKPEDVEKLRELIGKKVVEVRVDSAHDSYGFDLVFDDGTVLEVYDIRCPAMDESCESKKIKVVDIETGKTLKVLPRSVGGGVAWLICKEVDAEYECTGDAE